MNKRKSNNFAFYGTLRKGQGNHRWSVAQDSGAKFDGTVTVPGYRMHSYGGYPFVVPSQDDSIVVELYQLTDDSIMDSIHRMEIGAGYHVEEITVEGITYQLYVQNHDNTNYWETVPDGDWVSYRNRKIGSLIKKSSE